MIADYDEATKLGIAGEANLCDALLIRAAALWCEDRGDSAALLTEVERFRQDRRQHEEYLSGLPTAHLEAATLAAMLGG